MNKTLLYSLLTIGWMYAFSYIVFEIELNLPLWLVFPSIIVGILIFGILIGNTIFQVMKE